MNAIIQVNLPAGAVLKNLTWMQYGNWFFVSLFIFLYAKQIVVCITDYLTDHD